MTPRVLARRAFRRIFSPSSILGSDNDGVSEMKNVIVAIVCGLALGAAACGEEAEATEATAAATPPGEATADEAAPEEAAPEAGVFCCALETHLRGYRGIPYTQATESGEDFTITEAMVREECSRRQGTLTEAACDTTGVTGTCTEEHMIWHYREGADLASEEDMCTNTRHGTWATL